MERAIRAARAAMTDAVHALATRGTDACPINSRGWREIDRGNKTVEEILNNPVTNAGYLKNRVIYQGTEAGAGTLFDPDGITTTITNVFKAVLAPDNTGIYRIITAHPGV
jgi:hypothetical protein